ncbi:MAG TPA: neutral/alkaline ceramidase [Acidimicrobiales bacterium]|jgi:neutral ceramidase|nr:neutral/alkaline ceramidase [Acidimicrobiales bacterium]
MDQATFLVGRGLADITGEAAECGMLGYGRADQQTEGIHTRQRCRAFIMAEGADGPRVLLVVNDLPLVFDSVHQEVLRRLQGSYGQLYTATNTMITATHTHCAPGGYSHHLLYNSNTKGFRPKTFGALVDGIVEAVTRAHADLAPSHLFLSHGELHDASVNRSRASFERNPAAERAFFPGANDPQTTLLRIERDGATVGAVNWFATHNTSMTNENRLISSDNKGYAGYYWERVVHGLDYLADVEAAPAFVGAFAQTNAGDMSPNLNLHPGDGPTQDQFENTRIIGRRQYEAAAALAEAGGRAVTGPVDSRVLYVDLARVTVAPEFTGDGLTHHTSGPAGGSASFAGAWADGPAFPGFREGKNRWFDWPAQIAYALSERIRDSQAPKGIVLPGGLLNRFFPVVAQRVPVQLLRVGPLYLIGIPGEVTITAGLRLRRTVAERVGAELADVLVAGYSNGYIHYVTTPEEYQEQRYEGASTLFGRWELPALAQTAAALATAMAAGAPVETGPPTADLSGRHRTRRDRARADATPPGRDFGDLMVEPRDTYRPGQRVTVVFVGAHPNSELHRGGTYLEVRRQDGATWPSVQDDGDWDTRFRWERGRKGVSEVTVRWDIPEDAPGGHYRIRYHGDARAEGGALRAFTGTTPVFEVSRG